MNANAIQIGHEYAYVRYPSRGVTYYPGAERCRVMYVYKVEDEWKSRKQTLVEVEVLNNDTGESVNSNGHKVKTLRARQIVARWDEHVVEKERHEAKDRERRERIERENEEYLRQQEERRRKREELNNRIYELFESIGIPRDQVYVSSPDIRISRRSVEKLLTKEGGVE